MLAGLSAGPARPRLGCTTSCTGLPFLRRSYLQRVEHWAYWQRYCGERIVSNGPSDAELLPMDPATGTPRKQMEQPGYFPGYRTLGQKKFWDATTRHVVEERVGKIPPLRFFSPEELPVISAICERILPQDDRLPQYRVPVLNFIDERLWKNEISGYRFEDMPEDRQAYRLGIQAIDLTALAKFGKSFPDLFPLE